ncbi:uncharacterized protein BDR25DRAFT_397308 [Lindgomyces ingoldianus]|uniref:Uncharacterized protein n=1 Tax=Lindgomyces ingoldianus TaxID=673940 RepID=A0ACB6QAN1_9PLEO|nr:uncharacterized protein BDR25DRAFT_397308 [Lindgomyces ingoldianus]KAF2463206.1 hypothetical protein BDR25DRAFT_397308 [Lindgomyces ingoldianus]
MFFNPRTLLLGTLSLLFTLSSASDCDEGPWAPVSATGSSDTGSPWCETKWKQGPIITGVEVWSNNERVRAIRFSYSDGSVGELHGRIDGDRHGIISWDPANDKIIQATTWGDGKAHALGRLYLKTQTGKELNVGKDTGGQASFDHDVGSGIMMTAFGRQGYDIDQLGFNFLRGEIKKITIGDVKFEENPDDLNAEKKGLQPVSLDYQHLNNINGGDKIYKEVTHKRTEKTSKTWTQSTMHTFGIKYSVEISGEVMDIGVKASYELSYQFQRTDTISTTVEDTKEFGWTFKMEVSPGKELYCREFAWQGVFNGKYTSTVSVELEDGYVFQYPESGQMNQVQWSESTDECRDTDFDDGIPKTPAKEERGPDGTDHELKNILGGGRITSSMYYLN